jgi:TonB family protein
MQWLKPSHVGVCVLICHALGAYAQCTPPPYREGATFADTGSVLVRSISIPFRDFHPSGVVCLAARIRARYPQRRYITIHIFFSHEFAERSLYGQETNEEDLKTFSQLHARYTLDADKHDEYVEIMPTGVSPELIAGADSTRIDLPIATKPHCRLEIDGRCLLASHWMGYPMEALRQKASGAVALAGTVTPSGKVRFIRVVKTKSSGRAEETILTNAAVQNLSSWRLETAPGSRSIRITYSFKMDDSLPYKGRTDVHWSPGEVAVRASPAE